MKRLTIQLVFFTVINTASANDTTHYYKCTTDKGTTFSQLPCSPNATKHTLINHTANQSPKQDHIKTLNNIERTQTIRNLNGEIRSKKHEIAILKRNLDRAKYQQQQRTKRILSEDETKRIKKDIVKKIAQLDTSFKAALKSKKKQLAKLEKQLARYK
ncbi:DUF4124 domain-containing protein [Pseudoalteromonas sp.]|uniref:DUF4124 domain-containing protein n=1 Tax=unclassified Pseudoalteromonas TaxID=194690 RepID=UPI003F9AADDA